MEISETQQVAELTAFFASIKDLPEEVQLGAGTKIIDLPKFIDTHLTLLKPGVSPAVQGPALDRIMKLRGILNGKV